MNALDHQQLMIFQPQGNPLVLRFPATIDELETWRHHVLARHHLGKLVVKKVKIDGIDRFEVRSAILVDRGLLAIDVIVVEGQRDHFDAVDPELGAEAFRECRLA